MEQTKIWDAAIKDFINHLKIEKSLSNNSILAYRGDLKKLTNYLIVHKLQILPQEMTLQNLEECLIWFNSLYTNTNTQARFISALKSFYKYLLIEDITDINVAKLLDAPSINRKFPDTLSVEEIDKIVNAIDLASAEGQRNKAIVETLYGCGLRVSELCELNISNIYFEHNFIIVIGKGNKERLVPIGETAKKNIKLYMKYYRDLLKIDKQNTDILFLNRRGKKLSRVMIFNIIKELSIKAGLNKKVSPHTFRHSFASHLIEGGADLRAVQDMLGHESITTTEIYTHLNSDYLRDTIISFHPRSKSKKRNYHK